MQLPKRFALSTILLLMFVVAAVFGYAQWRRQWLKAEVEELVSEIDPALLQRSNAPPIQFHDNWFWPTVSTDGRAEVRLFMEYDKEKGYSYNNVSCTPEAAVNRFCSLTDRLHAIGVGYVSWWLVLSRDPHGNPFQEVRVSAKVAGNNISAVGHRAVIVMIGLAAALLALQWAQKAVP
jgi:hypothetical protein